MCSSENLVAGTDRVRLRARGSSAAAAARRGSASKRSAAGSASTAGWCRPSTATSRANATPWALTGSAACSRRSRVVSTVLRGKHLAPVRTEWAALNPRVVGLGVTDDSRQSGRHSRAIPRAREPPAPDREERAGVRHWHLRRAGGSRSAARQLAINARWIRRHGPPLGRSQSGGYEIRWRSATDIGKRPTYMLAEAPSTRR